MPSDSMALTVVAWVKNIVWGKAVTMLKGRAAYPFFVLSDNHG